jgi:hypothetical protein
MSATEEKDALDELHGTLARADVSDKILKNAFIPDDIGVLIDAGLRLMPVLESAVAQDGAAGRMRAIVVKLSLHGNDPTAARAARELGDALKRYEHGDRVVGYWVMSIFLLLLGLGVYVVVRWT